MRGVTLVELLINIAIISGIGTITAVMLVSGFRNWQVNRVRTEIQRDTRQTLDLMIKYIRQAQATTIVITRRAGQPPYSDMTFTTIGGNAVEFYQDGTTLYEVFDGNKIIITKNVRALLFAYPSSQDGALINISVSFEGGTYEGGTQTFQLQLEKVRIMN